MKKIKENLSRMLIVVCGFLLTIITKVKADSGFDGSYDSGGGSFDFDYDYDVSSGSEFSSNNLGDEALIYFAFALGYTILCIWILNRNQKNLKKLSIYFGTFILQNLIFYLICAGDINYTIANIIISTLIFIIVLIYYFCERLMFNNHKKLKSESIRKKLDLNFDEEIFYKKVFEIYKDIQIAWMDNKLEDVRDVLSDEIFNMYKIQLMTLTAKNQKNMMEEITFNDAYIMGIRKSNDKEEIDVCLTVTCRDYIIDINNGEVLRGDKNSITEYVYKLTFVRTNNVNKERKCPSCRADLGDQVSTKCPNCGNIVVDESSKFIMTNKKIITQSNRRG